VVGFSMLEGETVCTVQRPGVIFTVDSL
jgi:hypothetical protein